MTEFEFDSTPETDAMLKQICIKECFVRCKDCKYWRPYPTRVHKPIIQGKERIYWDSDENPDAGYCERMGESEMNADDFCSRGEQRGEEDD